MTIGLSCCSPISLLPRNLWPKPQECSLWSWASSCHFSSLLCHCVGSVQRLWFAMVPAPNFWLELNLMVGARKDSWPVYSPDCWFTQYYLWTNILKWNVFPTIKVKYFWNVFWIRFLHWYLVQMGAPVGPLIVESFHLPQICWVPPSLAFLLSHCSLNSHLSESWQLQAGQCS